MKVLFDHQAFTMQTHGGVSRCFVELYKHLPEDVHAHISVNETNNIYLREMGVGVPRGYKYEHFIMPKHFPLKGRLFSVWNYLKYGFLKKTRPRNLTEVRGYGESTLQR